MDFFKIFFLSIFGGLFDFFGGYFEIFVEILGKLVCHLLLTHLVCS